MAVDAGPNGQDGHGGHAHNDTLSFELYAHGQTWLVDPGIYTYTADYAARNLFRSSAYHNAVVVDGQEINPLDQYRLFSMANQLPVCVHCWIQKEECDFLDAAHHGYRRLAGGVTHRRQICFDKRMGLWVLRDLLAGSGKHTISWYFHLAPEIEIDQMPDGTIVLTKTGLAAKLLIIPDGGEQLSLQTYEGWVSPAYGLRNSAWILEFRGEMALPAARIFAFCPSVALSEISNVELARSRAAAFWNAACK